MEEAMRSHLCKSSTSSTTCSDDDGGGEVRRGPWTAEEDSLLIHYISSHGEGRWNLLAKRSGLKRTGKSCRLRWLNYLKPDIKRGNLSPEEQLFILDLHSKWGNRWSRIAQYLPGRTDNEIKNYWRTRVQKQARHLKIDSNSPQFHNNLTPMALCSTDSARANSCRDGKAAAYLKLISIFVIFFTSVVGISLPIFLARLFQGKPAYDKAVLVIKCFAAGVILSTSLVHVLPDAFDALADCQVASHHPWKDFPFSGLITLIGVLTALLVDLTASSHVEGQSHGHGHGHGSPGQKVKSTVYTPIGMCDELGKKPADGVVVELTSRAVDVEAAQAEEMVKLKQRLVSQVLEIGIIFHSVIIGVTMGMSQNKCTIRPLVAALSFHQIFEGMGLGGCIAQAGFSLGTTAYMCFMFSVTTPLGIVLGMIMFSITGYDDSSPNALIMEGLLGSLSSGILIYMALVDLIALDFFHNKLMNSHQLLKRASFVALVIGSTSMSILALWA